MIPPLTLRHGATGRHSAPSGGYPPRECCRRAGIRPPVPQFRTDRVTHAERRLYVTCDANVARQNLASALPPLLQELAAWKQTLPVDIQRLEHRGFRALAGDLRRLLGTFERVHTAGRVLERIRPPLRE